MREEDERGKRRGKGELRKESSEKVMVMVMVMVRCEIEKAGKEGGMIVV